MKKYSSSLILLAILMQLPGCKTSSKDAVDLKFKLPKGSKYEYSMTTEMNMKQKMMEQEMNIKNSIGFTYLFEVIGDSANWKTLLTTISKISMDVETMGGTMHFDTDTPMDSTNPMAMMGKIFGAMKGGQFSFTVNDKGEVGEVRGIKEMQEKMLAGVPNTEEVMERMKGSFDEETLRQNMEQTFAAYPGKPVRKGDQWTKSITTKTQGMNLRSDNTYTLESVNGNDAVIKTVSKLSSAGTSSLNNAKATMTGTAEGSAHYDLSTGISTYGNNDLKMDMKVKSGDNEVPVSMNMKILIKGKKI